MKSAAILFFAFTAVVLVFIGLSKFTSGCVSENMDLRLDGVFGVAVGALNLAVAAWYKIGWNSD